MKILKIFFVGVGLIIGLLLSASIGGAFDNFLQLKYTSNYENYWSEFRDIQNSTQSEVLYINPKVLRLGSLTPHFIAKLSYKGEVFRTQLEGLGWSYKDGVYRKIVVNVNIRMYNFDDVQCTVIPSVAYGFVTGMNLQLC